MIVMVKMVTVQMTLMTVIVVSDYGDDFCDSINDVDIVGDE